MSSKRGKKKKKGGQSCYYFKQGYCKFGDKCNNLHTNPVKFRTKEEKEVSTNQIKTLFLCHCQNPQFYILIF